MKITHLLQSWDSRCAYCGRSLRAGLPTSESLATRDHFIPRRRRGPGDVTNIVPACRRCNGLKDSIDPRYFLMIWLRINPANFFRTVTAVLRHERMRRQNGRASGYPQTPANDP